MSQVQVRATQTAARRRVLDGVLLAVAIMLVAANLRPAVTSLGSVLEEVRGAIGAPAAWASLLTALPPVCFGFAGLAVPVITRRLGLSWAVCGSTAVIAAGLVARVSGGAGTMFLGTFVACGGIAVCNVLIPVVIKENFPDRIGLITGCYTAALQSAAALGAALTPQLYGAFGGWRPALGGWASIAVLAVLVWAIAAPRAGVRSRQRGDVSAERPKPGAMLRNPLAWLVTAYFGCQSLFAYVIMGWLPEVLVDAGVARGTAGVLSGLVSLLGVPVSLIITPLAARRRSQAGWASGLGVLSLIGAIGLMLAPAAAPILWSVLIGFGMGSFAIAVALISLRSATPAQTEALSTMTQSIGYLISATGPLAFGVLHGVTDSWTLPFLLVIVVLLTQITIGAFAGRDRYV